MMGIKYVIKVEEAACPRHLSGSAILTRHRRRPTMSSRSTLENHNDLHNWFRAVRRSEGGCTKTRCGALGQFLSILSFLYWRNWNPTYIYSG